MEALVIEHIEFANAIAAKFCHCSNKPKGVHDELRSEAYVGLCKAAKRFDTTCNNSFKTYAYPHIRGALIDYVRREQKSTVYQGNHLPEGKYGHRMLNKVELVLHDFRTQEDQERCLEQKCTKSLLNTALAKLPSTERIVIENHYFNDTKLEDIAKSVLRLSKGAVSRYHRKGLKVLGKILTPQYTY